MRWILGRRRPVCASCGAELDRTAVWCGSCGARVVDEVDPEAAAGSGEDGPAEAPARPAGWVAVAVALALVGAVAAVALLRSSPPELLLGRVGTWTGVTAAGMPPAGLEVAWEHDLGGSGGSAFAIGGPSVIADGDRLRIGGVVLDRSTGDLVRASWSAVGARHRLDASLVGDELVVGDTLTGQVRSRTPLGAERPEGQCCRPVLRSGDAWLLSSDRESVLVAEDGTEVGRVDAVPMASVDIADADAAAVPLRASPGGLEARLVLVDPSDGDVVHEVDDGRVRVAEVRGEIALLATPADDEQQFAAGRVIEWTVELLDASTGTELTRFVVPSHEAPRLLGVADDDRVVLGLRQGSDVQVHTVEDGGLSLLAEVQAPGRQRSGDPIFQSTVRAAVGMADGVLVALHDDEVRAWGLDAEVRWRRDSGGTTRLVVGDGIVALGQQLGSTGETVQVLHVADGTPVANFPSEIDSLLLGGEASQPSSVVDGHVGLGAGSIASHGSTLRAASSVWLDLRTGAQVAAGELLEPLVGEDLDDLTVDEWWVHGTIDGGTPLVTSGLEHSTVQVLQPGQEPMTVEVRSTDRASGGHSELAGVTPDAVVVTEQVFDGDNRPRRGANIVDLRSGEVTTHVGLHVDLLTTELLVATDQAPAAGERLVGIDLATGERRWTTASAWSSLRGRAWFDDTLLVVSDPYGVTAIGLEDGATVWRHAADRELARPLVLGESSVLLATTAGEVVALDRGSGDELWRTPVGTPVASLAGAGDGVVAGTFDGHVVTLDGSGQEVQRISLPDGPVSGIAALGDTVVATAGGRVIGLRADGGAAPPPGEVRVP